MKPKIELYQSIMRPSSVENDPNWEHINALIDMLPQKNGTIGLSRRFDGPKADTGLRLFDEYNVTVAADCGQYLITYFSSERDKDEEEVFCYDNPDIKPRVKMVDILGDLWDASMICSDVEIVRKSFKTFHETGDFWMEGFI